MRITDQAVDQAYLELKGTCGGVRNDYFGLLYVQNEFAVPRDEARNHVAFGGNDYGVDGYFFDRERRNFYLFQFKYSEDHAQFKGSFQRLIYAGMERIFGAKSQDAGQNELLLQIRSCLLENQAVIDKVYFHFIFKGDPAVADSSKVLEALRENLESKHYLLESYFGRDVTLVIEFRSAKGTVGPPSIERKTRTYLVGVAETLSTRGPKGEHMLIGFVKLRDLNVMYQEMRTRFFERNIRSALPEAEAVNIALSRAYKRILIQCVDEPSVFLFNHNGVTLAAEKVEKTDGEYRVTEPRLLNGAQTITTFARFMKVNADNPALKENSPLLDQLRVICKIITQADPLFVTAVTINNNRQNPVEPWNLRANDMIQLELHDKFQHDLGIYYERQERAFEALSDEELDDSGITQRKPIQLVRLAQTFLVVDGEIDKFSAMRRVFEDDKTYERVFNARRLEVDSRKIVLCYKIQFRLRLVMNHILDKGPSKYGYLNRARPLLWALLCQGTLNHPDIERIAKDFGQDMTIPANLTELLAHLATTRCRFLITDLANHEDNVNKIDQGKFGFLRTNASYKKCMEFAFNRWKWVEKGLM